MVMTADVQPGFCPKCGVCVLLYPMREELWVLFQTADCTGYIPAFLLADMSGAVHGTTEEPSRYLSLDSLNHLPLQKLFPRL